MNRLGNPAWQNVVSPAWREVSGVDYSGLGSVPTQFADGSWWMVQSTGVGAARVMRYGLGDIAGDMEAFNGRMDTGDQQLAAGDYQNAVLTYQSGGNVGVTSVGPDIDNMTGGASKSLTQQAWEINRNLAAVNNGVDATVNDAQSAQGFLGQMENLYATAAALTPTGGSAMQPSSGLVDAATSLANYISTNGCNGSQDVTKTFQTAYNKEGSIQLAIDGKYGPLTSAAVSRVLGSAPPPCHGSTAVVPGGKTVVAATTASSKNYTPWIIGGVAVAGAGVLGYAVYKKKRGRR
jgi:hypothetical protein